MKYLKLILLGLLLFGCNGDNVPDCFQNSGDIIQKEISLDAFDMITVFERIELILIDGPDFKVVLETGEYLENDISAKVENGRLLLRNENSCNLTRNYGITKFYVTAPNITEIRNSSGLAVRNEGVLNYPFLRLISEDFEEEDEFHTDGHFELNVNVDTLEVIVNNLSHSFIEGTVKNLTVNFYSGDARFEGANLIAENIDIYHRGTNDMVLNPTASIEGTILSVGDVILVNEPPILNVEQLFSGKVIIRD